MMAQRVGRCWSKKLGWERIYGGLDFMLPDTGTSGHRDERKRGGQLDEHHNGMEWGTGEVKGPRMPPKGGE